MKQHHKSAGAHDVERLVLGGADTIFTNRGLATRRVAC